MHKDVQQLVESLKAMSGSSTAQEAARTIQKFNELLLPISMMLAERAFVGEPVEDDKYIFTFMGTGGSAYSRVSEFRALIGDEREDLKEYEEQQKLMSAGGCTPIHGCLKDTCDCGKGYRPTNRFDLPEVSPENLDMFKQEED